MMNAKTISMYPLAGSSKENDIFLISQDIGNSVRQTKSIELSAILNAGVAKVKSAFTIPDNANIGNLSADVYNLKNGNMSIGGTKTFSALKIGNNNVATESYVTNKINGLTIGRISGNSTIECYPDNSSGQTKDLNRLLQWSIDAGGRDSSMSRFNRQKAPDSGMVTCQQTGNLVVYGWLADNGNLAPENCWVALFAEIKNKKTQGSGYEKAFTALQVQPWIVGENSQVAQYVSFNVPVAQYLKLKIMTGFNVNGSPTGFGRTASLMPTDSGSMINHFVGYVIQ